MPFPAALDNHQYYNAKYLEDLGLAEIFAEKKQDARELTQMIKRFTDGKIAEIAINYERAEFPKQHIADFLES